MATLDYRCEECGGTTTRSAIIGFAKCLDCGKLQVVPEGQSKEGEAELVVSDAGALEFELKIPDYTEVMIGWRAWAVPTGEEPRLWSVSYSNHYWEPRMANEAICSVGKGRANGVRRNPQHDVPAESCRCGLYSAKTREHLKSMNYHAYNADVQGFNVMGTVSIWGKIVEGDQGWRSQFGYPRELFVPFEAWRLAKPLSEAYGVPVRLNNILAVEA